MKRLLLSLAVATLAASQPVAAQTVRSDATSVQRPDIDTAAIARALADRGVPDDQIAASIERIRYWLSLGASPARIRAFLNQQNGDTRPDRPDRPDVDRPEVERPEAPVARGSVARPIDRPVARGSVAVRPNDVQPADTARLNPRIVRPAATRPLAGN